MATVPAKKSAPAPFSPEMSVAIGVLVGTIVINAILYTLGEGSPAVYAFTCFSIEVTAVTMLATVVPREVGHLVPALSGIVAIAAGVVAFTREQPRVLSIALAIYGLALVATAAMSWKKSRAGWAFLCSLSSVLAVVLLFGSPKVRALIGVPLWQALIIPGLLAGATIALAMVRRDYDTK